jgi:hypothetical protein
MSPLGRILFEGLADANRRIAEGVPVIAAAETLHVELTAAITEDALALEVDPYAPRPSFDDGCLA